MVGRTIKWKKREKDRVEMMKPKGCVRCWQTKGKEVACDEIHHIISGNKRMGHWYTLPLCNACHDDAHNGTFKHKDQIYTWQAVQCILGLDNTLPKSKIVPRRAA